MKATKWAVMAVLTLAGVSGCGIGGMWMEGKPAFLSEAAHPPKFITLWNQPGVSEEQKMRDWLACPGGRPDGDSVYDTSKPLPGETETMTLRRVENDFYRCLIRKGYRYKNCDKVLFQNEAICEAPPKQLRGGALRYDDEGNAKRGLTPVQRIVREVWAGVAIIPSTPFAMAELLPPSVWNAISLLLRIGD